MLPLSRLPEAALARVEAVFVDIDDTLTTEGKLLACAYSALESLQKAGVKVIPITGRPAGWCDHIARMWPVDAVVGENGAFYFHFDEQSRKLKSRYMADDATLAANTKKRLEVADTVLATVPGCALASDQFCRTTDLAIDFCEDVAPLPRSEVERIQRLMQEAGMHAKISSIHVNGWFGEYDKLSMTRILMRERYGIDLAAKRENYLYVGDSPNDEPMFEFFPLSVGVANVRAFMDILKQPPKYVTEEVGSVGFVEVAERILAARAR